MDYARIVAGAVASVGGLPGAAQRADTGQWVSGFQSADQATREACGYLPVNEVRPPLGADQVHGAPVYTVGASAVTATYPVVADAAPNINLRSLFALLDAQIAAGSPARNAIATNSTYIALGSPSAAQTTAEVKALAQQNNVIIPTLLRTIRVLRGALDDDK